MSAIRELLQEIDAQRGLIHAYWKASRRLEEALQSQGDYDLLVLPEDRHRWEEALHRRGFQKFRPRRTQDLEEMAHYVGIFQGQLIHLHLHFSPLSGEYDVWEYAFGTSSQALRHRVLHAGFQVYCLRPELEFLLLLLRSVGEPKMGGFFSLSSKAQQDLDFIWEEISIENLAELFQEYNLPAELFSLLKSAKDLEQSMGEEKLLRDIYPFLKGSLSQFQRISSQRRQQLHLRRQALGYAEVLSTKATPALLPSFRQQRKLRATDRGLFVAIVGPDGAGKSTLTVALKTWLDEALDVEQIYLGKGNLVSTIWQGLAEVKWTLLEAAGKERPQPKEVATPEEVQDLDIEAELERVHALSGASSFEEKRTPLREHVWELSRVSQALRQLRKSRQARKERDKGRVVLTDRFPHHQERFGGGPAIQFSPEEGGLTRILGETERLLLTHLVTRQAPDVVIRLAISAEEAWKRKPDHNYEEIRQKVEAMERVRFPRSREFVLDSTEPFDEVLTKAKQIIWDELQGVER